MYKALKENHRKIFLCFFLILCGEIRNQAVVGLYFQSSLVLKLDLSLRRYYLVSSKSLLIVHFLVFLHHKLLSKMVYYSPFESALPIFPPPSFLSQASHNSTAAQVTVPPFFFLVFSFFPATYILLIPFLPAPWYGFSCSLCFAFPGARRYLRAL